MHWLLILGRIAHILGSKCKQYQVKILQKMLLCSLSFEFGAE